LNNYKTDIKIIFLVNLSKLGLALFGLTEFEKRYYPKNDKNYTTSSEENSKILQDHQESPYTHLILKYGRFQNYMQVSFKVGKIKRKRQK
jgi:hypothetical protein